MPRDRRAHARDAFTQHYAAPRDARSVRSVLRQRCRRRRVHYVVAMPSAADDYDNEDAFAIFTR